MILPEAEHYSGGRYKWINWLDPLVPLPPDVAQDMSQAKTGDYTSAGRFDISGVLSGLPQGERNNTIFRFCCWLRRQYRDDWDFVVGNTIMANARCIPPLDEAGASSVRRLSLQASGFFRSAVAAFGNRPNRDLMLKAHDGDPITVVRV